jgi:hypothetical protein
MRADGKGHRDQRHDHKHGKRKTLIHGFSRQVLF